MKRYWSPSIRHLSPYVPGEQATGADIIKLNTNESPYPPSPRVIEALRAAADDHLERYPDPQASGLARTIAAHYGLDTTQVFLGNGSDEVLAHAFRGLLQHDQPILFPDITYSFYPVYCELFGIEFVSIPLDAALAVNTGDYLRPNGGIVLANPNAPTGLALSLDALRTLLDGNRDSVVVIDEAYVDFGADSAALLINDYDNLLVCQTLSKSRALAGLRTGFALGHADLIAALETVKGCFNSYPLDKLAQAGATAAFEDQVYYQDMVQRIVSSRTWLTQALEALGFDVIPSATNFLLVSHPHHAAAALHQGLREDNILVRYFNKPRLDNHLRITIGTQAECEALITSLRGQLGESTR